MTLDPYLSEGHAQYVWPSATPAEAGAVSGAGAAASQSARTVAPRRPPLARRRTALRLSGEFATEASETRERFAGPKGVMPLRPARHPTNLRLQDHLQIDKMPTSESKSQFVDPGPGESRRRPPARRHATTLKIEGDMDISPEYRTAYTQVHANRPPMIKPKENLTAHGQMFLETEKREMFQNFPEGRRRPAPARQPTSLKMQGLIDANPETKESFTAPEGAKRESMKPEPKATLEGTMYPEYKDWYLDFPRGKPLVQKGAPPHNFRFDADLFRRRMPERRQTMFLPAPAPPRRTVDSVCLDGYGGTGSRYTRPLVRFDSEPAFLVHERDEAECNRRAVYPLSEEHDVGKNRGVKRVNMGLDDGAEGDSSERAHEAYGTTAPSAFRVLQASGLSTESEDVDERLTSLKLDQEANRSKSAGAIPADFPAPFSGQPVPPADSAMPLYCATANAPFYCTGASPPHHLYFGGFCPNWTQANGLSGTPSYCPSIVPPQGSCPTAPPSSFCPAFLPPIHPYVSGCCPPPVQVAPPEYPQDQVPPSTTVPDIAAAVSVTAPAPAQAPSSNSGSGSAAEKPNAFLVLDSKSSDSNNNHLDRKSAN